MQKSSFGEDTHLHWWWGGGRVLRFVLVGGACFDKDTCLYWWVGHVLIACKCWLWVRIL